MTLLSPTESSEAWDSRGSMKTPLVERLLPDPAKHLPYLDAVRGIAVLFILCNHAWLLAGAPSLPLGAADLARFPAMMSSGVDLFFVLSGMLLSAPFLRADARGQAAPRYGTYLRARFWRIAPPYWLALLASLWLLPSGTIPTEHLAGDFGAAALAAHLAFAQILFPWSYDAYPPLMQLWTLSIEVQFYLWLPLAVRAFFGGRWWQGIVVAFAVSAAWLWLCRNGLGTAARFLSAHDLGAAVSVPEARFVLSRQLPAFLPHFAVGIGISALLQAPRRPRFLTACGGLTLLAAGIALWLWATWHFGALVRQYPHPHAYALMSSHADALRFYYLENLPFALAYGAIILGLATAAPGLRAGLARIPGLRLAGVLGYAIYLLHLPLMTVLERLPWIGEGAAGWPRFAKLLILPGGLAIAGAALVYFMAVERPCMKFATRASRARGPALPERIGETIRES